MRLIRCLLETIVSCEPNRTIAKLPPFGHSSYVLARRPGNAVLWSDPSLVRHSPVCQTERELRAAE